jgi:quinol monooxygenase YgiN
MTEVIVSTVFQPAPDAKEQLITALRSGMPAVHSEKGCMLYAIHDAEDGTIVMLEKWASQEDLDAHAAGPALEQLDALVAPHLARPVTWTTMTPIPAGTDRQGVL